MNEYERRLVWVNDKEGREYLCTLDSECNATFERLESSREIPNSLEELSACERASCRDVEEVLGVEWW